VQPTVDTLRRAVGKVTTTNDFVCDKDKARAERVDKTLVRDREIAANLVAGYDGRFYAFLSPWRSSVIPGSIT
jgi:hypothetical protein